MKKTVTLGVLLLGLFATSVQAKTKYCHTIEHCQQQISERKADVAELHKNMMPELTGILKTGVSHDQAEGICRDRGMRLPTARELALVSQSLGAQGISETKDNGYYLVKGSDSEGNPDHFYFSHKGYKRPAGELWKYWFWSSSAHPDYSWSTSSFDNAYLLKGDEGVIDTHIRIYRFSYIAVRCVVHGLFATSVQAKTKYCHTIEDCRQQIAERKADVAKLLKNVTPELTGILSTRVSLRQAEDICRDRGMRLPTARELALVAQNLGAEGISETKKDGYYLIRGVDSAGNPDDFYYNERGYRHPAGDLGNYWFWSSSLNPDRYDDAYTLKGPNGDINNHIRTYNNNIAVRCVLSR